MEQSELLSELRRLFQTAKRIDEFEFVNVLIGFNGMGDQRALTHLYESRAYIADMQGRYQAADHYHSKVRLGLHIYCHIFEMDELYNILGNLLRIAIGQQLRYIPDIYNGYDQYYTPTEKFQKLTELAKQCWFHEFINSLKFLYFNELRNGFVHSAYSLINNDFCLVRGNGISIGGNKHQTVSINHFLVPLIEKAIEFIEYLFKLIDESKSSYRSNTIVQARLPELQSVVILGNSETGLVGFQTSSGSWIKIQSNYGSQHFVKAMNLSFNSRVPNKDLNDRLATYIEKLTPFGKEFNAVKDDVLASMDPTLTNNLAIVYYNWANNTVATKDGKPLRQQESILKSALDRYNLAININPDFARAYHNKAATLLQLARLQNNESIEMKHEALLLFEKALSIDPHSFEGWVNSAKLILETGNIEKDANTQIACFHESIKRYRQAINLYPRDAEPFENLGWLYRRLAHITKDNEAYYQEGIKSLEKASKLKQNLESSLALATIIGEYGQEHEEVAKIMIERAIEMLESAQQAYGQSADLSYRLGNKYMLLNDLEGSKAILQKAAACYEVALQLDSVNIQIMNNAANCELHLSLYEEDDVAAIKMLEWTRHRLEHLLYLEPAHATGWYNSGLLSIELAKRNSGKDRQKLLEKAVVDLEKGEEIQPDLSAFDLARAHALVPDVANSMKWLRKWLTKKGNTWTIATFKEDFSKIVDNNEFKELTSTVS